MRSAAHPEPRIDNIPPPPYPWLTRVVTPAAIVLALIGLFSYAARDALLPARDVHVVPVVIKPLAAGDAQPVPVSVAAVAAAGEVVVQAAGWIEPDPYPVQVAALADGIVREIRVLEGEAVTVGDVIATLVDDDAKLALAKAEAELSDKQAALVAAQKTWDHPVERRRAADVAEAAVAQASADVARLDAELAQQRAKLSELADARRRAEESAASRSVSESEIVSRRLQHEAQAAAVEATQRQRDVLAAQVRQREAERTAAMRNLELRIEEERDLAVARAAVARATAQRDEARLRLDRMTIRAPIDGVVLQRHVVPGSKLVIGMDDANSATAVHLYDPKQLQVRVDVPQADAAKVSVGQPAQITAAVLGDRSFKGEVTRVVHEADVAKNTVQFKVRILDPDPRLKPEMLARVKFFAGGSTTTRPTGAAGAANTTIFAPARLLTIAADGRSATAWTVDRRAHAARRRDLRIRQGIGEWTHVVDGLGAGDELIVEHAGLTEGQRVRVVGEAELDVGE